MEEEFAELEKPEHQRRIAHWEGLGLALIKADLEHRNGIGFVGRHVELAWKWVKFKETQAEIQKNEIDWSDAVELKPGFMGISIDLKRIFKKVKSLDW